MTRKPLARIYERIYNERMAETPLRAIRVPDEIWQAALKRARGEGLTLSSLIVDYLRRYGRQAKK